MAPHTKQKPVKVIFRTGKRSGEVTAVFPELVERQPYYVTCYSHNGQHGTCSKDWYLVNTRPSTEGEYRDLYDELIQIGYQLRVCKKWMD